MHGLKTQWTLSNKQNFTKSKAFNELLKMIFKFSLIFFWGGGWVKFWTLIKFAFESIILFLRLL